MPMPSTRYLAGMTSSAPIGTRKHASGRLSTSQNSTSIPPGVAQYHRGASSSASGSTIAIDVRVNEMIPSGNWHAR
jgi:hypothetical protein